MSIMVLYNYVAQHSNALLIIASQWFFSSQALHLFWKYKAYLIALNIT